MLFSNKDRLKGGSNKRSQGQGNGIYNGTTPGSIGWINTDFSPSEKNHDHSD